MTLKRIISTILFFLANKFFLLATLKLCSGYMSPEYASDGQFSVKSDVYSFGVILMEIVSGKKNRLFDHADQSLNLLGHVREPFFYYKAFIL